MKRFFKFSGGALLLAVPQLLVSLAAIYAYTSFFIYPQSAIGFHLTLIATFHLIYYGAWARLARIGRFAERREFRILYVLSMLFNCVALNVVYLCSYTSYRLWGSYVSWENVLAITPHLRGFQLAMGAEFYLGAGAVGAFLLGYVLLAWMFSRRLIRRLQSAYADPSAGWYGLMLITLMALLTCGLWLVDPNGERAREMDPIIAFWSNQAASAPKLTPGMIADRNAGLAYRLPADFHRRDVIIVSLDCMRADHLSFRGYGRETTPFISSLARQGRLQQVGFATSNGNDSRQGIRTMLSARYPHRHNLHNFKLQDLLQQAGYKTHVFATGDHTTLGGMRRHYGPAIEVFSDGLNTKLYSVNDDRAHLEALAKLEPSDGRPAFFLFHIMGAHSLSVHLPEFARWQPALLEMSWTAMVMGDYSPEVMTNTYDNGLLQADHFLKEIFRTLQAKGYLKDYVGVITGDHGEGLGERGHYGHTRFMFREDTNVPIMFLESTPADYGPMPFGSHVDIAPTLLDRLGLPRPDRWDGKSLYRSPAPDLIYAMGTHESGWRVIVRRQPDGTIFKYLFYGTKLKSFRECIFNEVADPGNSHNLADDPAYAEMRLKFRQMAAEEYQRPVPPLD